MTGQPLKLVLHPAKGPAPEARLVLVAELEFELAEIAESLIVAPLETFVSEPGSDVSHDAADGIMTVESLIAYVDGNCHEFEDARGLLKELAALKHGLEVALDQDQRFALMGE